MKKIFIILIIIFAVNISVKAQGNLQFSQIKMISTLDTVPNGKVWKVESIVYSQSIPNYNGNSINQDEIISINGQNVSVRSSRYMSGTNWFSGPYGWMNHPVAEFITWEQKLPMWLPAGTTINVGAGVQYINAIEYNIVP